MAKWFEILIESVNCVVISYALSNMALAFQSHPLFILFFASEIWIMARYRQKVFEKTQSSSLSVVLLVLCFIVQMAIVYLVGRIVGVVMPFRM